MLPEEADEGARPRAARCRSSNSAPAGRAHLLTEIESKQLLAAYGIPTVADCSRRQCGSRPSQRRGEIGYPVVLKLFSETITHKTDVGGVQLNLRDEAAVRGAYQADSSGGDGEGRGGALPGRDRAADGQARRATS